MIRLALRVRRAQAEVVLAQLLELVPNGVEESTQGDVVEYAIYGAPGELPELPSLRAAAGEALCEVVTERLPDDWYDGWKRFHRPVVIGETLRVRPPGEEPPSAPDGLVDVVIDPGQAFGTGSHHTTRTCLEAMLDLTPGGRFVDLGCGSGVLAIAAAKLGWSPVLALDHETAAVAAARDNVAANGVELAVARFDLRAEPVPPAETMSANLLAPLLLRLAEGMTDPPAHLVAGGLLRDQADEVSAAFARCGLAERDRREAGEWATLLLERRRP